MKCKFLICLLVMYCILVNSVFANIIDETTIKNSCENVVTYIEDGNSISTYSKNLKDLLNLCKLNNKKCLNSRNNNFLYKKIVNFVEYFNTKKKSLVKVNFFVWNKDKEYVITKTVYVAKDKFVKSKFIPSVPDVGRYRFEYWTLDKNKKVNLSNIKITDETNIYAKYKERASTSNNMNVELFKGYTTLFNNFELNDDNVIVDEERGIFVSPLGNDQTGDGSILTPYKTIAKAFNVVAPGNTIYLREGTYNERIRFTQSGTSTEFITVRNYPNEVATIDGTNANFNKAVDLNHHSNIAVIGLEICNFQQSPSGSAVDAVVFRGGERNILIANNDIHDMYGESAQTGNAHGINLKGTVGDGAIVNVLIKNNKIYDCVCGRSEALVVSANSRYIDIVGNTIHDVGNIGIDIAGNYGNVAVPEEDFAQYVFVSRNEVYNCSSVNATCAGIYCDGASNIVLHANKSHGNQVGLEIGAERTVANEAYYPHNILAINNLIYDNTFRELGLGGYSVSAGTTYNVSVWNNTIIHPSNATSFCLEMGKGDGFDISNNIILDRGSSYRLIYSNSDFTEEYIRNFNFNNNYMYHPNAEGNDNYIKLLNINYSYDTFENASFTSGNILGQYIALDSSYKSSLLRNLGILRNDMLKYDDISGNRMQNRPTIGCYQIQ